MVILGLNVFAYVTKIDLSMFWLGGVLVLLLVTLRSDSQRPKYKLNKFQDELSDKMEAKALDGQLAQPDPAGCPPSPDASTGYL